MPDVQQSSEGDYCVSCGHRPGCACTCCDEHEGSLMIVNMPWGTFALITEDGIVTHAPPIAKWAVGRTEEYIWQYFLSRGGDVRVHYADSSYEEPAT